MPRVSVLMAVYNGEKYLGEALESIKVQTFTDYELIFIDDGSSDRTSQILKKYQKQDSRIIYIRNEENIGLTKSLNKGIQLAKGHYIARMDGDDISLPQRFEKQVKYLDCNKDIAVCATVVRLMDKFGTSTGLWQADTESKDSRSIKKILPRSNCIAHSSVMIRADILKKYGYNVRQVHSQDWDLWLRLVQEGLKIGKLSQPLVWVRAHDESITQKTLNFGSRKKIKEVRKKYIYYQIENINVNYFLFQVLIEHVKFVFSPMKNQGKKIVTAASLFLSLSSWIKNQRNINLNIRQKKSDKKEYLVIAHHSLTCGGVEKVLIDIANSLREQYQLVMIATDNKNSDWKGRFEKAFDFVVIHDVKYPKILREKLLISVINRVNPSGVIYSHSPTVEQCLKKIKKSKSKIFIIDITHSEKHIEKEILIRDVGCIDRRVVISQHVMSSAKKVYDKYGLEKYKDRLTLIYNGVDEFHFRPAKEQNKYLQNKYGISEEKIVLFIGRIAPDKDPDTFLEIAKYYKCKDIAFVLVGDATMADEEYSQKIIDKARREKCVYLLGRLEDIRPILHEASIMIVTSPWEGVPIAVLEAMACGVPVIAGNVGALNEIIENSVNGILVPRDEIFVERVCEQIEALFADPVERKKLSLNARNRIKEKFTIKQFGTAYHQVIKELDRKCVRGKRTMC